MKPRPSILFAIPVLIAALTGISMGQFGGRRSGGMPTISQDRKGIPSWSNDERFKHDVFTFVRVQYSSGGGGRGMMFQPPFGGMGQFGPQGLQRRGSGRRGGGWGGGGGWATDYPDSDLNFSLRLSQLTSLRVNPDPIYLQLTDPQLFDYPFLYMIEPGRLIFTPDEVIALRRYLLNGGFMMVDDFWGDRQWQNFYEQMKLVFPDPEQEPEELKIEHEIFRNVYQIREKPQVPSIHSWQGPGSDTWEDHGPGSETVHYKGIFDGKGRMMVIICHNTDLGDGWEREGENEEYFREFSEKRSYPMGINIVTYAMTH